MHLSYIALHVLNLINIILNGHIFEVQTSPPFLERPIYGPSQITYSNMKSYLIVLNYISFDNSKGQRKIGNVIWVKKGLYMGGKVKNVFGNIQHALSILSHYKFNISFRLMYEFKNIYFWRKELLLTMFSATGERLAI